MTGLILERLSPLKTFLVEDIIIIFYLGGGGGRFPDNWSNFMSYTFLVPNIIKEEQKSIVPLGFKLNTKVGFLIPPNT